MQARLVATRLREAHGLGEDAIEIVVIRTSGDRIQDRPLSEVGGKGLFTKEIEEALLANAIDLAVHSMKDMATRLPNGLVVGAVLVREDVRDCLISLAHRSIEELPKGAVFGTSSLRRQAQIKRLRPDLQIVGFRGNVETRLAKLEAGRAVATLLAMAGLKRLGRLDRITAPVPVDVMLPAPAQGAIAIEIREGDRSAAGLVAPLDHATTGIAVRAERAYLARLDGSCRTPIAGYAELLDDRLRIRGQLLAPDGSQSFETDLSGPPEEPERLGAAAADVLIAEAGPQFIASLKPPA
jgi:hydroxymethylbilane synthase